MRRARAHVRERDERGVAGPLDDDAALALLHRLGRDDARDRRRRPGERAELRIEERQRAIDVEVAGEDRLAVVGMEERAVVLAQLVGGDALDVGAIADRLPVIRDAPGSRWRRAPSAAPARGRSRRSRTRCGRPTSRPAARCRGSRRAACGRPRCASPGRACRSAGSSSRSSGRTTSSCSTTRSRRRLRTARPGTSDGRSPCRSSRSTC